jgi:glycosyltransferase involved in cell wall biosynthesis
MSFALGSMSSIQENKVLKDVLPYLFVFAISLWEYSLGKLLMADLALIAIATVIFFIRLDPKIKSKQFLLMLSLFLLSSVLSTGYALLNHRVGIVSSLGSMGRFFFSLYLFFFLRKELSTLFFKEKVINVLKWMLVLHSIFLYVAKFFITAFGIKIGETHPYNLNVSGVFEEPAHASITILIGLFLLRCYENIKKDEVINLHTFIFILSSIFITGAFGGEIIAVIFLIGDFFLSKRYKQIFGTGAIKVILILPLFYIVSNGNLLLIKIKTGSSGFSIYERTARISKGMDNSAEDRVFGSIEVAKLSLTEANGIGVGFGAIRNFVEDNLYRLKRKKNGNTDVHISFFSMLTVLGVLGGVAYLLLFITLLGYIGFWNTLLLALIDSYYGGFAVSTFWFVKAIVLALYEDERDGDIFIDPASFTLPFDYYFVDKILAGRKVVSILSKTKYNTEFISKIESSTEEVKLLNVSGRNKLVALISYINGLVYSLFLNKQRVILNWSLLWPLESLYFILCKLFQKEVMYIEHNVVSHELESEKPNLKKKVLYRLVDKIVCVSEFSKNQLVGIYPEFREKAFVYQHGVMPLLHYKDIESLSLKEPKNIIFWGNVKKYKGIDYFIDLFADHLDSFDYQIYVYGKWDDSLKNKSINLCKKYKNISITDRFIDNSEIFKIINSGSVIVMPYLSATQSGVLYTLLNYGVPFISTDCGENGEFLKKHNLSDLIFDINDKNSLMKSIDYLSQNYIKIHERLLEVKKSNYMWNGEL